MKNRYQLRIKLDDNKIITIRFFNTKKLALLWFRQFSEDQTIYENASQLEIFDYIKNNVIYSISIK
jgi:hypothetical protein